MVDKKEDIVNSAFARIGANPIQSLSETTIGGAAAARVYDDVVGFLLDLYNFSFCRRTVQLTERADATPLTGFDRVYALPAERLGPPLRITDDVTDPDRRFSRYLLQENELHADPSPLFAEIKIWPEPHHWPRTFKEAVVLAIAAECALAIAHDDKLRNQLRKDSYGSPDEFFRGGALGAAIRADSFATPPRSANWDDNLLVNSWVS